MTKNTKRLLALTILLPVALTGCTPMSSLLNDNPVQQPLPTKQAHSYSNSGSSDSASSSSTRDTSEKSSESTSETKHSHSQGGSASSEKSASGTKKKSAASEAISNGAATEVTPAQIKATPAVPVEAPSVSGMSAPTVE